MKRYTPKILIKYLIKEFAFSLLIFTLIFSSLIILTTFVEELIFFKEKEINNNFFLKIFILTLIKSPTLIFNFSPFIFLFSGIFFYVRFLKNNEISPMSLSGFSLNFITLVPAIFSFFLGVIIITILTPVTSQLSKYYESVKQKYSDNDNLLIMSNTGIWIKENKGMEKLIIRADRNTEENFSKLKNITIYIFNNELFKERIAGEQATIKDNEWHLQNVNITSETSVRNLKNYIYTSAINLEKLKSYFSNSDIYSIWNINNQLEEIRDRGYYGQELIIKLNKQLSLPFLLFSMIIISTLFTIKVNYSFNNFIYIFLGILIGIVVYFFNDLSIALGESGKIPLILSVWMPVILLMIYSIYSLIRSYD